MGDRLSNEEVVRRYAASSAAADLEQMAALRHPNWSVSWPQSGEQVHSHQAFAEILRHYPGGNSYLCVDLLELREGLILHEIVYWAPPFNAPDWRAPWVEQTGDPSPNASGS